MSFQTVSVTASVTEVDQFCVTFLAKSGSNCNDRLHLSVGHLGIVAGAYDSLGIADVIDTAIPKTRHHNLSHSQVVKLMALNGLGFIERRLYLFPEFFDDIAVERLLGEGITTDQINDDLLGR